MGDSRLQWMPSIATDKDGKEHKAETAQCSCGCLSFFVHHEKGVNHPHLQCPNCDATYCGDPSHHERPN